MTDFWLTTIDLVSIVIYLIAITEFESGYPGKWKLQKTIFLQGGH